MGVYRKRPVEVEAYEFTGDPESPGWPEGWLAIEHRFRDVGAPDSEMVVEFETIDGNAAYVGAGNFVVRGVEGEFYPCRADVFWKTYERTG
ncbi:MAG: hypothetical protein JRN42_04500 [Nitrososphaerota archaeon]|nr:hypothetical protein [Nitrososphaerota archaeon]